MAADQQAFDQLVLQLMSNQNAARQSAEQHFGKLKVQYSAGTCNDRPATVRCTALLSYHRRASRQSLCTIMTSWRRLTAG